MPRGDGSPRFGGLAFPIAAGAIVLLGIVLRFQSLDAGLPHWGTRPDEEPILRHTVLPAAGEFDLGWSVYPPAFVYTCWAWAEGGLRIAQATGRLPAGDYPEVYRGHRASFLWMGRALSATLGSLAVLVMILLCHRRFGTGPALLAGLMLATGFLHARDSHTVKPDVALSLAVLVSLGASAWLWERTTLRRGLAAGVSVGAAMAVKYPGVLLLFPFYAASWMRSPSRGWRRVVNAPAIAGGALAGVVFLATSPFLLFDEEMLRYLGRGLTVVFPQLGSPDVIPIPSEAATDAPGAFDSFLYHLKVSLWHGVGPGTTALLLPAVGLALWRRNPLSFVSAILLVVWLLVISSSVQQYARYLTPVVPAIVLLVAWLVGEIAAARPRAGRGVFLIAALLLTGPSLLDSLRFNQLVGRMDTRNLATAWLAEELPSGSRVAIAGKVFWPWGEPMLPPGMRPVAVPAEAGGLLEASLQSDADVLLTHDHERVFSSHIDPRDASRLREELPLLVEFDPRVPDRAPGLYEKADAYYAPFHGFDSVERTGPIIRIFDLRRGETH